jgi:hypothetical protein
MFPEIVACKVADLELVDLGTEVGREGERGDGLRMAKGMRLSGAVAAGIPEGERRWRRLTLCWFGWRRRRSVDGDRKLKRLIRRRIKKSRALWMTGGRDSTVHVVVGVAFVALVWVNKEDVTHRSEHSIFRASESCEGM